LAQSILRSAKLALPKAVADQGNAIASGRTLGREKNAPQGRPHGEHVEESTRHLHAEQALRFAAASEDRASVCDRGHRLEDVILLLPVEKVQIRTRTPSAAAGADDGDDAVSAVDCGQGTQQVDVEEAENDGIRADAKS